MLTIINYLSGIIKLPKQITKEDMIVQKAFQLVESNFISFEVYINI